MIARVTDMVLFFLLRAYEMKLAELMDPEDYRDFIRATAEAAFSNELEAVLRRAQEIKRKREENDNNKSR